MNADTLHHRTLAVEDLDRSAFQIHGQSTLGSAYLIGSLSALVPEDIWAAAIQAARMALAADRERAEAAKS